MAKRSKKSNPETLIVVGVVLLTALALINAVNIARLGGVLNQKIAEAKEASRPAKIVMDILLADCDSCFDIEQVVSQVKSANVELTEEDRLSPGDQEFEKLSSDLGIKRYPTVVLLGEIDRLSLSGFEKRGDALVYTEQKPPYVEEGRIKGLVDVIVLEDPSCEKCPNMSTVVASLKQQGVAVNSERVLDYRSADARKLIEQTGLGIVPAALISREVGEYPFWQQTGIPASGDYYILEANAPAVNITTGSIFGRVDITFITDSSCTDCYDVSLHRRALANLGVVLWDEATVDVSEAGELIEKYNITAVPTYILTGDLAPYERFRQVWSTVGTVESDGTYVFRNMQVLGNVKYVNPQVG